MSCLRRGALTFGWVMAIGSIIGCMTVGFVNEARANDSAGYIATGGVQYIKNPHIRMQSEDLYISEKRVRVQYLFVNDAEHDITETVLFPLPAERDNQEGDFADVDSMLNSFQIWVDGKTITPNQHIRALWQGRDVTESIRTYCGLEGNQLLASWHSDNEQRTEQCVHKLIAANVTGTLTEEQGAHWSAQVVYSWQQTFPAKTALQVKHQYSPLVGGGTMLGLSEKQTRQYWEQNNCLDANFYQKLRQASPQYRDGSYTALRYILTTGANWARPIEYFKLTIDKSNSDQLMSLCWDSSLKKISATRFEAVKRDFTPTREIDLVFVQPFKSN